MEKPRLEDVWPDLASELRKGLLVAEKPDLAGQISELRIEATCGCGDRFCQSIHTIPPSDKPYPDPTYTIEVGDIQVDVAQGNICYIEIMDHDELESSFEELARIVGDDKPIE